MVYLWDFCWCDCSEGVVCETFVDVTVLRELFVFKCWFTVTCLLNSCELCSCFTLLSVCMGGIESESWVYLYVFNLLNIWSYDNSIKDQIYFRVCFESRCNQRLEQRLCCLLFLKFLPLEKYNVNCEIDLS